MIKINGGCGGVIAVATGNGGYGDVEDFESR
jgi:hypothetical protein